jgi:BirA family biotin operon repressor/biotin-[acetyl-CoA-carboxylase] ligase
MTTSADGLPAPYRLVHLPEIDSTNAEAMRRGLAGERGPLWVLADRQTAGRGRSGRTWVSEPGNLYASLLIETGCPVARAGQLSLVAGVATIDALRNTGAPPPGLRLKWPNDVLIGRAKAGGILVESSSRSPQGGLIAVIGVGINLAAAPSGLEPAATNLAAHGLALSPQEALCFLADAMDAALTTWNEGEGFVAVRASWLAHAGAIGEPLAVRAPEGSVEGHFSGLDEEGALLITVPGGGERRIAYGDVTLQGAEEPCSDDGSGSR